MKALFNLFCLLLFLVLILFCCGIRKEEAREGNKLKNIIVRTLITNKEIYVNVIQIPSAEAVYDYLQKFTYNISGR